MPAVVYDFLHHGKRCGDILQQMETAVCSVVPLIAGLKP